MKHPTVRLFRVFFIVLSASVATASIAFAQNFDPDSFGKSMKFAGAFGGGSVYLDASPAATPPPAGGTVVVLNPQPLSTSWDVQNTGQFVVPKHTAQSIIYLIPLLQHDYRLGNETATAGNGFVRFDQTFTIENDALKEPGVIDPATGLPANGKLINNSFSNVFRRGRSLQPGENDSQAIYYTRASFGGINRQFFLGKGIPASVVDKIFKNDTTIRVNMSGSATFVTGGSTGMQFRVFTD